MWGWFIAYIAYREIRRNRRPVKKNPDYDSGSAIFACVVMELVAVFWVWLFWFTFLEFIPFFIGIVILLLTIQQVQTNKYYQRKQ